MSKKENDEKPIVFYVENTQDYAYELQIRKDKMVSFAKTFSPRTLDENGKVLNTGFTMLTESEKERLEKETRFNSYVAKKLFVIHTEVPEEALTDDTRYQRVLNELEETKAKLAETSPESLLEQIEALKAENKGLKEALTTGKTDASSKSTAKGKGN